MTNQRRILDALRDGQPAVVATDTVYGLIACPGTEGHRLIFDLKKRPVDQALPCLVSGAQALDDHAVDVPSYAYRLADMFWPGPLTLVLAASEKASEIKAVALNKTIALRCPDSEELLELMSELESILVSSSANIHGEETAVRACDLPESMLELSGAGQLPETCCHEGASTIVDCTGDYPKILRQGPIPEQVVLDVACFGARLTLRT